ncbi:protein of unknown function [Nonomuraea solani]|uniref:DUF4190 domain-containing protein n=1 Tax=Nonomuraea solani TaxID=1144553 RepID=A0A1H5YX69_9ACTN|nr:DUF4190 domain-containing protein [Nonomuraea solani]SEG28661.1 protein of unknown function [Nonomuraea solani]
MDLKTHSPALQGRLAVVALILSVLGLVTMAIPSIAGVGLGHVAYWCSKQPGGRGRDVSVAAVAVGYVGIAFYVIVFAFADVF